MRRPRKRHGGGRSIGSTNICALEFAAAHPRRKKPAGSRARRQGFRAALVAPSFVTMVVPSVPVMVTT